MLQQAIWEERKIKIAYEKANKETSERIIEPLGLVAKGRTWYLIAVSNKDLKNFRVSRIKSVRLLNEPFVRPANFNLADYWTQSKHQFVQNLPVFEVEVEASPKIIQRLSFSGRFAQIVSTASPNENGWIPVKLSFDTKQEAASYIIGFGDQMKIVSPDSLIESVKKIGESALSLYK